MSVLRRSLVVLSVVFLATGIGGGTSSPASANHTCSTEICYPDLCINIKQKPYTIFC